MDLHENVTKIASANGFSNDGHRSSDRQKQMTGFWADKPDTVEGMMLDFDAAEIDLEEAPEVMAYLPNLRDKSVLEIGSGIGRFTGHLAKLARSVHAVDFIQSFVDKNRLTNGKYAHVTFECNDAMKVDPPSGSGSLDVVFTNWLMMYLSDDEVQTLAKRALTWLKNGGYFFVRESCFHPSGNMPRKTGNPTYYRDLLTYSELFQVISNESGPLFEGGYEFELQFATSVKTYIKKKRNPNQICWLYRKVTRSAPPLQRTHTLQEFLDGDQYTQRGILKYERIYGKNFISVGGRETAEVLLALLDMNPGACVLDVGAGIGGASFLMVQAYDAYVLAMDLSSNMVTIAMQRRLNESAEEAEATSGNLLNQLSFEISDINHRDYEATSFDCIHSRETLLHLKDKPKILQKFQKWLKPGGKLLITDYCRGEKAEDQYSRAYRKYIQSRGYFPVTISEYATALKNAGFVKVSAIHKNDAFKRILHKELATLEKSEKSFANEFSQYEYDQAVSNWRSKIRFCEDGDLEWGLFLAEKPNG